MTTWVNKRILLRDYRFFTSFKFNWYSIVAFFGMGPCGGWENNKFNGGSQLWFEVRTVCLCNRLCVYIHWSWLILIKYCSITIPTPGWLLLMNLELKSLQYVRPFEMGFEIAPPRDKPSSSIQRAKSVLTSKWCSRWEGCLSACFTCMSSTSAILLPPQDRPSPTSTIPLTNLRVHSKVREVRGCLFIVLEGQLVLDDRAGCGCLSLTRS